MDAEEAEEQRLRERLKNEARYHAAPAGLAARILASLPPETLPQPAARWNPWWTGSAFAAAFVLVLAVAIHLMPPGAEERLVDEIVAGHVRSLMVDHAADIASSDRHTVKPWFAGKLDFAPPVHDLTARGFVLVGGRLDYIDHRPVAALVYRHRQHLINLYLLPAASESAPRKFERRGFHLIRWARAGISYWAVSDLNPQELEQFSATLASAAE